MKPAFLITMMLMSMISFSQPFLGLMATNKGAGLQAGLLVHRFETTVVYQVPIIKTTIPTIFSLNVARQLLITRHYQDNYSINAGLGVAYYSFKDFTLYDQGGEITIISAIRPVYGLEIGKDSYMGRIFILANYCKNFCFGIGMKVFPYRIKN